MMTGTTREFGVDRDAKYENFLRTMQRDGIPVRRYQDKNCKRWIQEQWERINNLGKN